MISTLKYGVNAMTLSIYPPRQQSGNQRGKDYLTSNRLRGFHDSFSCTDAPAGALTPTGANEGIEVSRHSFLYHFAQATPCVEDTLCMIDVDFKNNVEL